ncbi:NAD(P)-dependent oxidoreductase [Gluconobacter frateurii]|uniref:D-isomer specific 2-hydroxyacid dehydrogenase NAD-binding protein n=1 Tax=Gluconobacter frateurii NRIC 0228 TaxID=1307946 RepID=A0ABQ0QF70_9PROT|nr:NAD(P)-dependent oxidoreductase [Gluconobacter frateurii]GBR16727.1 D-isomer specific 2-hydroxyacid dehydrogenase NAD-binding protein [Gluconobacter frateurii NRIC 0228]GLP90647.1 dihydrofolate reductase [Gluconobacter frateurii]
MATASNVLTVINQIGPEISHILSGLGERVRVVAQSRDISEPWKTGKADILLTGPSAAWRNAPDTPPVGWNSSLRWVQIASAGVDGFPEWLLQGREITTGRGNAAGPIAEYVLLALLARAKRFETFKPLSPEEWVQQASVVKHNAPLGSLAGQTLGLAGYGAIGQQIARLARSFGMTVLVWRRSAWTDGEVGRENVQPVADLGTLFERSDHLVLALPLTSETDRIVGAAVLARAKPGLHLVNVARGKLIDEAALLGSLDHGRVAAATLDVTATEPPPAGHPFYTHPKIRLTPHISWSGPDVLASLGQRITRNFENFLQGRPLEARLDLSRGY